METGTSIILGFLLLATILISRFQVRMWLQIILFNKKKKLQDFSYCLSTPAYGYGEKVNQSRYRPEVPRGFQEVKVPRFRNNGTGWW